MGLNCKNLDFRSGVVKVSGLPGKGVMSLGNWWRMFPDHHVTSKFRALITLWRSVTYPPGMNCTTQKIPAFCQDRLTFPLSHTLRKVPHSTHYYYYYYYYCCCCCITSTQNVYDYTPGTNCFYSIGCCSYSVVTIYCTCNFSWQKRFTITLIIISSSSSSISPLWKMFTITHLEQTMFLQYTV
jgi:hypothetical protein